MALIPLPVTQIPAQYGTGGTIFTWTAGDATFNNSFTSSGREILVVRNVGISDHIHVIKSAFDTPYNRQRHITDTIVAGTYRTYQMFPSGGWATGGLIEIDPADAELEYLVLRVP